MLKSLVLLPLFLLFQTLLFAQWQPKNVLTNSTLSSVDFLTEELGYVVGNNKVFKTENGGDNWEISFTGSDLVFLEEVLAIDENKIVAIGKDFGTNQTVMIRSTNGGSTWAPVNIFNTSFLKSMCFLTPNIGYCSGGEGVILKSTNGGNTWQSQNSGTVTNLESIYFVNELVGIAVGGTPTSAIILKTTDGGSHWNQIPAPDNQNLQSVYFTNPHTAYIVGWNGGILKSENAGDTWVSQNSVSMSGNLDVIFTDENTGYIVGGSINQSLIQKTTNAGALWQDVSPVINQGLTSISFPSFDTGYAVGSNGTVVKTVSGGVSGVSDPAFSDHVLVFPNPVSEKLWVQSNDNMPVQSVRLYDTEGRLIEEMHPDALRAELDFTHLQPNVYFLEVHLENSKSVVKVVRK